MLPYLGNSYSCLISDRGVYLYGFDSYTPSSSNPIIVKIFGITNPNVAYTSTGYLKIALMTTSAKYFLNSNPKAATLTM